MEGDGETLREMEEDGHRKVEAEKEMRRAGGEVERGGCTQHL